MKVFVYGSLKRGYWNSTILMDSEFLFKATTVDSVYDMFDLGSFPAVVKDGDSKIEGEVYKIKGRTIQMLDALEGNGSFYNREEILVTDGNKEVSAWIYIYCGTLGSMVSRYPSRINLWYENNTLSWGTLM